MVMKMKFLFVIRGKDCLVVIFNVYSIFIISVLVCFLYFLLSEVFLGFDYDFF